jgi:hypothetical protein
MSKYEPLCKGESTMERIKKLYIIIGLVIAFGLFFEIAANADELDEATTISFSAPVQIPGKVLPAGTYLFKLADTESDLHLVQIFSSDGTVLYGTVQAIATERQKPTDDTAVALVEQGSGKPDALLKWFYPGRLTGSEFMYPGHQEHEIAQDAQHTILANANNANSEAHSGD